jgi:hypothetical protein
MESHDVPIDYFITNKEIIKTTGVYPKPKNIEPELLGEKRKEIPILRKINF